MMLLQFIRHSLIYRGSGIKRIKKNWELADFMKLILHLQHIFNIRRKIPDMITRRLVSTTGVNCSRLLRQAPSVVGRNLTGRRGESYGFYSALGFSAKADHCRLHGKYWLNIRHYATAPRKDRLKQLGDSRPVISDASMEEKSPSDIPKETLTAPDGEEYDFYKVETRAQLAEILKGLPEDTQLVGSKDSTTVSELLKRVDHRKNGAAPADGPINLSKQSTISNKMKELRGKGKEEPKLPRNGLGAGIAIVTIMAIAQGVHTFAPEDWDKYFAITISESPFGSTIKLNPIAMILNVFSPANMSEWVLNSFVGFYTFRVLAIVFGNTVTIALGILAGAWANRAILYEAEKTYDKAIEKETSDGSIAEERVTVCKGLDKATCNTTFIFSLAAFVGCIFPNAMVPLVGPCPLIALPTMGALSDCIFLFRLNRTEPSQGESKSLIVRASPDYFGHLYGMLGGVALWFMLARWTTAGRQLRSQSRSLQYLMTKMFLPMSYPGSKWF
ncbi:hypothetical protein V1509DRAFT_631118 [Lipomyces kononenkoae]